MYCNEIHKNNYYSDTISYYEYAGIYTIGKYKYVVSYIYHPCYFSTDWGACLDFSKIHWGLYSSSFIGVWPSSST